MPKSVAHTSNAKTIRDITDTALTVVASNPLVDTTRISTSQQAATTSSRIATMANG